MIKEAVKMFRGDVDPHPSERGLRRPTEIDPSKVRIDYSIFHDLFHSIWDPDCKSMPGGRTRHAKLWWEYRGEPVVLGVLCRLGYHRWGWAFQGEREWVSCAICWEDRDDTL